MPGRSNVSHPEKGVVPTLVSVQWTVIGSSGTYPTAGNPCSGYLLEHGDTLVWVEAGPGTFTGVLPLLSRLSAVVVSHRHVDHCLDLLTALHALAYGPNPRRGLPLFAPAEVFERLAAVVEPSDSLEKVFSLQPVGDGDKAEIGELAVSFAATDHPVPTIASRWEGGGGSICFSADTGPEGHWMDLAMGADLLVCEASVTEPVLGHLTGDQAASIATQAGVGALLLTHLRPTSEREGQLQSAARSFDGPIEFAEPRLVWAV